MRREYPILFARTSTLVATPLITYFALSYVAQAVQEPAVKMFPLGLSIFGITAALSSMSFSMARAGDNEAIAKYAGEKFLHSAILLIQCLLVLYIRDTVVEIELFKNWSYLLTTIKGATTAIVGLLAAVAAVAWFHGYEELNQVLWEKWRRRREHINTAPKDQGAVLPPKAEPDVLNKASSDRVDL